MEVIVSRIAALPACPSSAPEIVDVWSRTTPRHRRRAILMLIILGLLFAGLCCFTFWLRTGKFWPWTSDKYLELMQRSFNPTGTNQITLSDFLTQPISVHDIPSHAVTMGLLLASLSSIPILMAILYRLPFALIFCAMVIFIAAMPWLGITAMIGCGIACLKPFRLSFRYASALLGLVPIMIYFISASIPPSGAESQGFERKALLYAPWVLAVLSSCLICALALSIARIIGYRPGGMPPVLAVLFAIPVILFHSKVGRDELEYRILERDVGPGSRAMFYTIDVGLEADRKATRLWSEAHEKHYDDLRDQALAEMIDEFTEKAETDRARASEMCDSFMKHFHKSRYIPNVLFLKGRALDQQPRQAALQQRRRLEFHADVPRPASRSTWETLIERYPDSDLVTVALYKVAVLDIRAGNLDSAAEHLGSLRRRMDESSASTQPAMGGAAGRYSIFHKAPASSSLGVDISIVALQARRLQEMLLACRGDAGKPVADVFDAWGSEPDAIVHPFQLLMCFDETDPHYEHNLKGLKATFPGTITADYVRTRLDLLAANPVQRLRQLTETAAALATGPPGAEALFYLAWALQHDGQLVEAKDTLESLAHLYPLSCWSREARERLSSLVMLEMGVE